ncbi:MAG: ATP:cob(I)alamin adenosyltransferase [Elusimicrobiales bacterium]|nr:ATP:cob(I)alamin adenosyltransferase [Elusimicrobiales bacterium]
MKYKPQAGKGDDGRTDISGRRIKKTSDIIMLNALIDEINALIGVVRSMDKKIKINDELIKIQEYNSRVSSNIAGYISNSEVKKLIPEIESKIKKDSGIDVNKFIFFGDDKLSSLLNLIRTRIRICELLAWKLGKKESAVYLNRLSDLFFIYSIKYLSRGH